MMAAIVTKLRTESGRLLGILFPKTLHSGDLERIIDEFLLPSHRASFIILGRNSTSAKTVE
jgi:hypothetical protein